MSRKKTSNPSTKDGNNGSLIVIAAIIGLIGTIITAALSYLASTRPTDAEIVIMATQTAEAKMAQLAGTNISQPPPTVINVLMTPTNGVLSDDTLSIRLPTDAEMSTGTLPDILAENSINIGLMSKPKTSIYYGAAGKNKEYQLPFFWCATSSSILNQNLSSLSIEFLVNDKKIPNEYVGTLKYEPNDKWSCISYATALSGWKENSQYTLEMKVSLLQNLNDGESNYAVGDYIYKLIISVP